ncbi:MAG: CehA/McbA family metallohydrolase [Oscillospiraceae bacterium]|nr:CehA/McbA family metallohydrolase [Oscillospiraceae bacterium]
MKHSKTSRFLSAVLAMLMVFTMFPVTAFAADEVYTKISSVNELVSGKYVAVASNGVSLGVYDNGWVTGASATVENGKIVNPDSGAVWNITVGETGVILTDSNGTSVAPKGGNKNGINAAEYEWAVTENGNGFVFKGQGEDTVYLAYNADAQYLKFRGYKTSTVEGNPGGYPFEFTLYKLEGESEAPEVPVEPETPAAPIKDGDNVVIWAPAYGKALSTQKTGFYNVGVDVVLDGEVLSGYGETEIWTVVDNGDGTFSFANGVQNIGLAESYSSMDLGAVNDDWELIDLGNGLYNVKNTVRGNFIEWYASKDNWSTYNSDKAATDGQFQLSFYVVPAEPETPATVEATVAEFLAAAEDDTLYILTGKVTDAADDSWKFNVEDKTGSVLVYGNKTGTSVENGDTVKVTGKRGSYKGTAQMVNLESIEIISKAEPEKPEAPIKNGDNVVIWAPAYGKALSTQKTGFYNVGVDVVLDGEVLSGYGETEIWTVVDNGDGTFSFANGGQNIGLAESYSSMDLGAVNDDWELIDLGNGLYNVKNTVRGNFMEWYASKDNWSTYNSSKAATDDQFQLSFWVIPAEEPEVQYAEKMTEVPEKGDVVVIYNSGNAMGSAITGSKGNKLAGIAAEVSENKLPLTEEMAKLAVETDDAGNYIFTLDGKYLTSAPTGNGLGFEEELTDCGKWTFEEGPDGTWYIRNVGANYNGNYNQALEYYSGFTTYGIKETEIYQMQLFLVEEGKAVPDGEYVIWAPAHNMALSSEYTGFYNKGVEVSENGGKLSGYGATEIWTVTNNDDGTISIAFDGKNLALADSYSSMTLGEKHDKWVLEEAGDGLYYVKNTVRGNYIEWYADKNNWSSYYKISDPGLFALCFTPAEKTESSLPSEGDEVVIYNLSAQGVLGEENDTQSINSVSAVIWEYETGSTAQPENGAVVFTVSKNGEYFRFYNEAYGYLCSNGTGNNAFYTQEASDDADWKITEGKSGGWNLESRTAKFNGTYSQFLEYYADCYKTYSMYNVTDYDIYEFFFYPLEEGVETYKGIVHMPMVNYISGDEGAYLGQDWVVEFEFSSAFPMEGKPSAELYYQNDAGENVPVGEVEVSEPLNGVYTATVSKDEVAKLQNQAVLHVTAKFEGNKEASGYLFADIIDEPSVGEVSPSAGSETFEEKRPVISAEIINAGDDAAVTMTVNGEEVESVYDGEKVTYTPSEDMPDGRTTVNVKVVRADGKETAKAWNFIVGEAQYELYFGQLHSHTTYSDGSGSLESALDYIASLPESANVDFVAFTDHSNYFDASGAANPEAALYDFDLMTANSQNLWSTYKNTVAEFNASQGNVVAIAGFEMTWSGGPGHINTFNTEGIVSRNNTTLNNKTADAGMKAYYALLSQSEGIDSISQFNHPGSTFGTFTDFAYWDALIDTRIHLVEVGNGEGQIGAGGYYPSYEYYTMALDKGWHVAPTNNQDNHKGKWGNANEARDVVITDDFSEEGIYAAIRAMRMYSTEDKNLEIGYTVNGKMLGSSFSNEEIPEELNINVTVYDPDSSDSISKVEVVVNSGKVAYTWDDPADLADGNLDVTLAPDYSYYYIRVTEGDGDLAVTAPVWVGESLKLGISSVETATSTPVTNEELTIKTTLFNSETSPATVKALTYQIKGGEVIGTDTTGYTVPASGTLGIDFSYVPETARITTITVTAVVELDGKEYTFSMDIELDVQDADKLVYIGIDASHYNEYVNGNYKDSMGNFGQVAAEYGVRTVTLYSGEDLIEACKNENGKYKAMILTAPSRRSGEAQASDPLKVYTDEELAAIKEFNANGGIVILAGWSDHYENYPDVASIANMKPEEHMAATQNAVLEALGSSLRIGDDATYDDDYNGGQAYRLYFNTYNFENFLVEGVEVDPENPHDRLYTEVFSHYGGASVYTVDGTLPSTVSPVVFGHSGTYSVDVDKDGLGGSSMPKYEYAEGDSRLMIMATEQLEGQGLIIVSGAAFMSNFEVQATIEDSGAEKNYSNYKICENLLAYINPITVTPIAEVNAQTEVGYKYTIEGIVTSNASGYDKDTAFFDCIYVQDLTGGICCFPVAGNYKIGDKVRVTGTTEFYQGEPELQVTSIEVIGEGTIEAEEITAEELNSRSVEGRLVTIKGFVESFELANELVQTIMVKDAAGNLARVFIDGYITTDKDVENLEVGNEITVTGIASYDDTFNAPEGPFPRIRIRDREDIVCTDHDDHEWSEWRLEGFFYVRECACGKTQRKIAFFNKPEDDETEKGENEVNPGTGAPVPSEKIVSAVSAMAVLAAAAYVIGKRK